ncbi:hypothetical protein LSUE1_G002843 [Lachnellula suecica]|uniref:Rhodopsin domain-containing protein n=1 Tax=Lachnellula suecica TaxID=602035 RepID=A0A8T9CHX9_9HELO|nr:hypothetical protein LSUE1_G002843 [Lachnellula suecica]
MSSAQYDFPPGYLEANQSSKLIIGTTFLFVLEVLFMGMFLVSRMRSKRTRTSDLDIYLMIPGFVFCIADLIMCYLFARYAGMGRHMAALSVQERNLIPKLEAAYAFVNPPGYTFPKLAILCLYLRIFVSRPYRWATYAIAAILIANLLACIIVNAVACRPFAFQWDKTIPGGECLNLPVVYTWFSIPNLVTDVAMLILPLPVVWNLKISTNQRVGVTITFLTGSIGTITGVVRFAKFITLNTPEKFADFSWYEMELVMWTAAESGVYLIAACLPSLRSLFMPVWTKLSIRSRTTHTASRYTMSNSLEPKIELPQQPETPHFGFERLPDPLSQGTVGYGKGYGAEVRCYRDDSMMQMDSRSESDNIRFQRSIQYALH